MILLIGMIFIPTKLFAAGNVAKIGGEEYATMALAVDAVESGETIEVLANATANGLTLESGVTLDVPANVTLTLTGNTLAKAGSIVKNNGLIIVDNGTLDISALGYSATSGLISGQAGLITIKSDGQVKMLDVWAKHTATLPEGWKPTIDSSILVNCESGAGIVIGDRSFTYSGTSWRGAISVHGTSTATFETLADAITAAVDGDIVLLATDVVVPSGTILINKDIIIDLNGHKISAVDKVLTIEDADLTITGPGTIEELNPNYGALYVKGSSNVAKTNYTNITVGANVTLTGWSPIFITIASDGSKHAYGVNITVNGATLKAYNDASGGKGHGIYINGNIQDLTNYPNITLNDNTSIVSEGNGIYAAGYANWDIKAANIKGVGAGLAIKSGKFTLNNTVVEVTGEDAVGVGYGNGINPTGAAIQLESNAGYKGEIELSINGGTYTSAKGNAVYEYLDSSATDTAVKSIEINGGTFSSGLAKKVLQVSDEFAAKHVGFVKGGTFSDNPATYVAVGYKNVFDEANGGDFMISEVTTPTGTKTISGTITNGNKATVQLKQGGVVLKTLLASETGEYTFTNVASGIYNITAMDGLKSTMKVVEVGTSNVTVNMTIPVTGKSELIIGGANTPNVMVDGLDGVTESNNVTMIITPASHSEEVETAIEAKVNDTKKEILYLDVFLGGDEEFIEETNGVLTLIVPFDLSTKKDIKIYRSHGEVNTITEFTKLDAKPVTPVDGTFYLDEENNLIYIYTNKFSTYAFAYTNLANPKTSDNILTYVLLGTMSLIAITCGGFYLNKRAIRVK